MGRKLSSKGLGEESLSPLPHGVQAGARAKVGGGDLARLKWLLDLLNRPAASLGEIAKRDPAELEAEVREFCAPVGSLAGGFSARLTIEGARDLIRDLRECVSALLAGATIEFKLSELTLYVIPPAELHFAGEFAAMFRLAAARLIEAEGQRIRVCARPECGRLFARRKRALYCGRKCSQMEQFSRYVARHFSE